MLVPTSAEIVARLRSAVTVSFSLSSFFIVLWASLPPCGDGVDSENRK